MLANPKRTKDEIVQWIREYFAANGNDCCAVIGISGGKDSSVVAALCVEALGAERVIGVLMPNGRQKDIADSKLLVDTLGIASVTVDIGGAYSKMVDVVGRVMPSGVSNQAAVNLPPRLRMATLYMVAQSLALCTLYLRRSTAGWQTPAIAPKIMLDTPQSSVTALVTSALSQTSWCMRFVRLAMNSPFLVSWWTRLHRTVFAVRQTKTIWALPICSSTTTSCTVVVGMKTSTK